MPPGHLFVCTLNAKVVARIIEQERMSGSLRGGKDENPPPVDINLEVLKRGHKAINWISQITSELDNDNDIAIIKDVRKESQAIVPEKV